MSSSSASSTLRARAGGPQASAQKFYDHCVFCKNNGEGEAFYSSHTLKDDFGDVRCPVLFNYACPHCGATGKSAHTVRYCPLAKELTVDGLLAREASITDLKQLRSSTGRFRGSSSAAMAAGTPLHSPGSASAVPQRFVYDGVGGNNDLFHRLHQQQHQHHHEDQQHRQLLTRAGYGQRPVLGLGINRGDPSAVPSITPMIGKSYLIHISPARFLHIS